MAIIKKRLAVGVSNTFKPSAITSVFDEEVFHAAYTKLTYKCFYQGIDFEVEVWKARNGVNEVIMYIDQDKFPSKAALVRYYREVKELSIKEL
jgi:hypothetical protein